MASGTEPWRFQVSDAAQSYTAADQLPGGYKRPRGPGGDLQASYNGPVVQHGDLIDSTTNASVSSGLGRSASNSPFEWQAVSTTYADPAAAAAAVAVSGPASSFGLPGSSIINRSCLMSQQQHQQQIMEPNSSNNVSHDVSRLYKQYRTSQEYAAAEMHPPNINSHAALAAAAAGDPAAQLTTDAVRAHQEQQLLRQQRQLLLKAQQAEAATAAAKAAQLQQLHAQHHQQQAALAARAAAAASAAFGGSQASTHAAQSMPLYGQFRPAMAAQQHWDSSAATSSLPTNPARHHAAPAAALGLPPRPAASSHHHQQLQQQQSLLAGGSSSSSGASSRSTVVFARSAGPAAAAAPAPAGSARPLGAWSGAFAVMNTSALPASQEMEPISGCFALECEEDLLSMGTGEGYCYQPLVGSIGLQQQQQQQQQHRHKQHLQQQQLLYGSRYTPVDLPEAEVDEQLASLIEESGSTRPDEDCPSCDMDEDQADAGPAGGLDDQAGRGLGFGLKPDADSFIAGQPEDVEAMAAVAAQAAALALTQHAAEERRGVVLQVLDRVGSLRKGQAVLTASPRAAVAAGAASVRSRLLITEVSLYTSRAANSQMALNQSNVLMGRMAIPDGIKYMPVSPHSFLFKAGAAWQFPAFVICLGSSYLQRMLARLPQLAEAVLACPGFEQYAAYLPTPDVQPARLSGPEAVATLATLRSVQFTCLFLATKAADQVHALGLLRFMLTNLSHNGAVVTMQQAANVEARCLEALEWRLGPFFAEDELYGDDEVLWAECMGHWNYGTHSDHYPETF